MNIPISSIFIVVEVGFSSLFFPVTGVN